MIQRNNVVLDLRGLLLVIVVGAWLVGILLASFVPLPSLALLIGAGAALIFVVPLWHDSQGRLIMLLIAFLLLGMWRYAIASPLGDPQAISAFIGPHIVVVRGSVSDEPKVQGRSRSLNIAVSSISRDGGSSWQDAHGQLAVQTLGTEIEDPYGANYGDSLELRGKVQTPAPHSPADIFASMAFPRVRVNWTGGNPIISYLYHARVLLANSISQSLPQPEASLLIALLLSLRTPALKPLIAMFTVTGTAHLIAPSGFKVTIFAGLVASGTRRLYQKGKQQRQSLLPAQKRRNWRHWLSTTLVIVSIAVYTILSGAGPAASRAGIMGTLLVIAPRIGRNYNIYTALALAALLMSIFDPFVLWDSGFLLSFIGTLGIVLLTPFFQRLLRPIERLPFGHYIAEITAVTLAAQTATLPIFVITFNQISFIAPVANILTVPLLGVVLVLGLLVSGAGLLFAPLALLCGWIAWPVLWYMAHIVAWCASRPGAYINVSNVDSSPAWLYYGLLVRFVTSVARKLSVPQHAHIPFLSRRMSRIVQLGVALLVILATGAAALALQPNGRLTITFLDVGPAGQPSQGEAILLHTPDGKTVLIDGGLDASSLAQALDSRLPSWQRSLDIVLLTTPRQDHLLGLQDIVKRYSIDEVIDAGMLHPNTTYALWRRTITERNFRYTSVVQGTTISVGTQVVLQVLWPSSHLHKGSDEMRDNGLIIRLVAPGLHILLLGAAAQSRYALAGLLAEINVNYLQAEIVQIVGEVGKTFPPELGEVIQKAHPSLLVITPASLHARQRKAGTTIPPPVPPLSSPDAPNWQVVQTAQVGTIEISDSNDAWSISTA